MAVSMLMLSAYLISRITDLCVPVSLIPKELTCTLSWRAYSGAYLLEDWVSRAKWACHTSHNRWYVDEAFLGNMLENSRTFRTRVKRQQLKVDSRFSRWYCRYDVRTATLPQAADTPPSCWAHIRLVKHLSCVRMAAASGKAESPTLYNFSTSYSYLH
jgi:hypothetical protein